MSKILMQYIVFLVLLLEICIVAQDLCQPSTNKCCYKPLYDEYNCYEYIITATSKKVEIHGKLELLQQPEKQTFWETLYFPLLDVQNVSYLQLEYCPFPKTIKKILDKLKINTVIGLRVDFTASFGNAFLTSDCFQGLDGLKTLHLNNNSIKQIDQNAFSELKFLTFINLHLNGLQFLNDYMFRDTDKLQRLDLSDNEILNLPENVFQHVTNLMSLYIEKNKLDNINNQTFRNLKNLEILDLSYNQITKFSENSFGGLKSLKEISLKYNKFNALPDYLFANLPNLTKVDLENCQLIGLPQNLFEGCGNLKYISLKRNTLESLPENIFADLVNLQILNLNSNALKELPGKLFQYLRNLKVLNLSSNSLVKLNQNIFKKLESLEKIYLKNNLLKRFDSNLFSKTHKLKNIILSNNDIQLPHINIPDTPFNILGSLENLDLSYNRINRFKRDWMYLTTTLNDLNLSHNEITSINAEDILAGSFDIEIDLTYNNISMVDFSMANSTAIKEQTGEDLDYNIVLLLDNNPMDCNCQLYDLIRAFNKISNRWVINYVQIQVGNLHCKSPTKLIGLPVKELEPDMVECTFDQLKIKPCSDICDCGFRPWDKALLINCEDRNLTELPKLTLPARNIYNQTHVTLTNNMLKFGPIQGMGYENVTKMNLSFNDINQLVWMPPKLEILSLDNNNIDQINNDMLAMLNSTRLTDIRLGGNPYICNCSIVDFRKFLDSIFRKKNIDVNNIKCANDGNTLIHLTTNDLCSISQVRMYIGYAISAILILLFGVVLIIFYRHKIPIIKYLDRHTPSWFPKLPYDAFICYSHKDEDFVLKEIISVLEGGSNPYKLCIHIRDWTPGRIITDQIITSIESSRKTLIILSPNFLKSIWGLVEFKRAHSQGVMEGSEKVIVVLYGNVDVNADLDDVLKAYLLTNTYVKWGDTYFWDNLRRALDDPKSQKDKNIAMTLNDTLDPIDSLTKKSNTETIPLSITVDSFLPNKMEIES